jgi:hypothetical protein
MNKQFQFYLLYLILPIFSLIFMIYCREMNHKITFLSYFFNLIYIKLPAKW